MLADFQICISVPLNGTIYHVIVNEAVWSRCSAYGEPRFAQAETDNCPIGKS